MAVFERPSIRSLPLFRSGRRDMTTEKSPRLRSPETAPTGSSPAVPDILDSDPFRRPDFEALAESSSTRFGPHLREALDEHTVAPVPGAYTRHVF
jgi:hypothetical protein